MAMTLNERLNIWAHSLTPDIPICVNCRYYREHYLKNGNRVNAGHCVYPRLKLRRDYDTCEYFEIKERT